MTAKPKAIIGIGMPGFIALNDWGRLVRAAFDSTPYLVGSAARGKQWRDVDVRLILDDEEFFARFPNGAYADRDERWSAVCWAWATFGRDRTGLPIDFQIQAATHANGHYGGLERVPLGIYLGRPEGPP